MFLFTIFHLSFMLFVNYICPFHEFMKGVRCKRITRCISSVGLYVPGGTAVLPSTALMLAVVCLPLPNSLDLLIVMIRCSNFSIGFSFCQPAQIAGCKTIVLATPPSRDGSICKVHFWDMILHQCFFQQLFDRDLDTLFPAGGSLLCKKSWGHTRTESWRSSGSNIFEIVLCFIIQFSPLNVGYFQAISAMAWGTASCPKVCLKSLIFLCLQSCLYLTAAYLLVTLIDFYGGTPCSYCALNSAQSTC